MRKIFFKVVFLTATISLFCGCVARGGYIGPNKVYPYSMAPRIHHTGFSVARPKSPDWYLYVPEQEQARAVFRKDLRGRTYSFVAEASLRQIPRNPSSEEDFASLVKQDEIHDEERFQLVYYHQHLELRQGQWCLFYAGNLLDKKAPNSPDQPLVFIVHGFLCIHPAFDKTVLHAQYSERGLKREIDPSFSEEGEQSLKEVRLESGPGKTID